MVEEDTRTRRRARKYLDAVTGSWGPIEEALPNDLLPPRISFHLSRNLFKLSQRLPLEDAVRSLREEVVTRCLRHRRPGRPVTHITLADVQALLALHPVSLSRSGFNAGRGNGTVQVVIPMLSPEARLAYSNPPATRRPQNPSPFGSDGRRNPRCYCPEEFTDRLAHLMFNPPISARLRAFHFGVGLPLTALCWDHIRSYFNKAVGLMANNAGGREPFEARIMALHSHLRDGGDYSTFVAIKSQEGWFNATVRDVKRSDA